MSVRKVFSLLLISCALLVQLPLGAVAADSPEKAPPGGEPAASAQVTVISNGIYKASILNELSSSPGIFTVGTDSRHPAPDQDMLYGGAGENPWSSYLSVYDYTGAVVYTSDYGFSEAEPSSGYAISYIGWNGFSFESGSKRATTIWTPSGDIRVEQTVQVVGSELSDSAVRVTTKVTNTSGGPREVGIRHFLDMMVADEDGVWYATRDPKTSYSQNERIYTPPAFDRFVATDDPDRPELTFFGSMRGPAGVFAPDPTPPDRFIFGAYSNHDYVWDYPEGQDPSGDSAVLYYWGWDDGNSPIRLASGKSVSVVFYLYAVAPGYLEPGEKEKVAEEPERDRPPEPAHMVANGLIVDPQQVLPGQEVRVSANICNSGEERGSLTASLAVNGVAEQSQSVAVSGGSCKQVIFALAKAVPGAYQVAVNGMTGQFTVLAPRTVQASVPSSQDTGLGTWGIAAIIAVAVALIAGLVFIFKQ